MEDDKLRNIPKEKFAFANQGERISDVKFDTKPIGYFKDALIRFSKNRASVVAFGIIIAIILYALLVPLFTPKNKRNLLDPYYSKKGPRIASIEYATNRSMSNGGRKKSIKEAALIYEIGIGVGTLSDGIKEVTLAEGAATKYSPVNKVGKPYEQRRTTYYKVNIDAYLEVGFISTSFTKEEYESILAWQEETGLQVIYPLIDTGTESNPNPYYFGFYDFSNAANYWYKAVTRYMDSTIVSKYGLLAPVSTKGGTITYYDKYSDNLVLEDNYLRDEQGNVVYTRPTGGGSAGLHQYEARILYYNYYLYLNGFEPTYVFGTDSQGYDLAYRMANGLQLSLLFSVIVSVINFIIGTMYGAVEGYYGGAIDLTLERVSDILAGIPFMVVATLFQMHFAAKVGAIPSLIFAFVVTGWIGTASRVRSQFYRFKNQEYVMAARTLGARDRRIIWKHIFPNTLGTIITSSVLVIPGVIFSESMLSFLGIVNLGGSSRTSLGTLLSEASGIWTKYPHLMIAPAVVISLLMICFNLFGNGLRDAFNPTLRGSDE
jgi:oligopeptide transport system permease protein